MNYRTATILASTDLGGSGTKTIDLNIRDIISRLILRWEITKGQHGMSARPYEDISKIELVDGSDVLFSMTGGEAQALCIYDRKIATMNAPEHMTGVGQITLFGIDFGRKLYDPELALDPTRFRNLQLKITWNELVSDTAATANELEVLAECFDEKVVSPVGFLMSKEHWSGALTAAGFDYIDLPTDYPIRKMLLKAFVDDQAPFKVLSQAKIDEENEKRIPFNVTVMRDYMQMQKGIWTPVVEKFAGVAQSALATYFALATEHFVVPVLNLIGSAHHMYTDDYAQGGKFTPKATTASPFFSAIVEGYLPNHCIEFPFGDPMDLNDWYDVTKLSSCRLRIYKEGVAASTGGVVLQQLRRY